ncbi:hypothetical protein LguiB_015507 [Lonicera macranthoides]
MATTTIISLAFLLSLLSTFPPSQPFNFIYQGFNNETNLILDQATILKPSGALRLTNSSQNVIGHVFHPTPIQIFNTTSPSLSSFSTKFVFAIVSPEGKPGGFGLAFTLSPRPEFPGAEDSHFLGILNSTNNGSLSNHIFAIEFDTVTGINKVSDAKGNNVGLINNSMLSFESETAAYYVDNTNVNEVLPLDSGEPIQAWIDYDGIKKVINVTISPISVPTKPSRPLISTPIDLTTVVNEQVYIGFSAATGWPLASSHYILGWSFRLNGLADDLDLSSLPKLPVEKKYTPFNPLIKALIAALSVIILLLFFTLLAIAFYRRAIMFEPNLEVWELDCPHRFKYKDLYKATKGFKESELVGIGGFGTVYKGIIHTTGVQIAVKRIIANNQLQGVREFVAEIECLGRLRHKHLVNLQGWCKRKNDLLLVYDYVPNGSLDSLLLNPKNGFILNWEQRYNIVKGVASGLLYLHEEWEQVVVHRDVKSSNVLIDGEMNGKLGDFGLARLHDHDQTSRTTSVVGTIGYIAPELTRTGKASTRSDVFAFGVLLLEVVCGRGPIVHDEEKGHVILVDWVIACVKTGQVLDLVDPRLGSVYVVEEVELLLGLGLLCSNSRPEARPSMRQIMRYLNGEELLNVFDKLGSFNSREMDELTSRFLELIVSSDTNSTSYCSLSIGDVSSSSLQGGR